MEQDTGAVPKEGTLSYGERPPQFELLSMLTELLVQFCDCPVWRIPKWLPSPGVLNIWYSNEERETYDSNILLFDSHLIIQNDLDLIDVLYIFPSALLS